MQPETDYAHSSAEIIRDTLLARLFDSQNKFWRKKLQDLIWFNVGYSGGRGFMFGIHYLGKNWRYDLNVLPEETTFLPLHSLFKKHEKDLIKVVSELAELESEEYEANRFLSGLVLFPAPVEIFRKVLGKQLFSECEDECTKRDLVSFSWDSNAQRAIMTYVNHHEYILKAMNQRLLINLITQDQTRQ